MTDELPKGWCWTRLGDVSTKPQYGWTTKAVEGGDVRLLRTTDVTSGSISWDDVPFCAEAPADPEKYCLHDGDVVVSRAGSVGFSALIRNPPKAVFASYLIRFILHEGVDPHYVQLFMTSPTYWAYIRRSAAGIAQPNVNAAKLADLPLPLAPRCEQRRIVEELERRMSHIDAGARSVERAMELLSTARGSVLNAVTSGSLTASSAASWPTRKTGDIADVRGGIQKQPKRKPVKNRYPFLRVANVGRGTLDLSDVHEVELFDGELERYQLERGDLLVVEGNGSIDQIGRAALWDGSIPNCVHQNHLIRVRPGPEVLPEFLQLVWNSPLVIEQLKAVSSSTSGLHTLSTAKVKRVELRVPSLDEQRVLVDEAQRRLSILDAAETTIATTRLSMQKLRRSLLAAAFRGQLVPQDPDDEPADVLLGRIRAERAEAAPKKKTRTKRAKETAA